MQIFQPASGYRYNTDSIVLADFACCQLRALHPSTQRRAIRLLDIGSGCGVLALLLARFLHSHLNSKSPSLDNPTNAPKRLNTRTHRFKNATKARISAIELQEENLAFLRANCFANAFKFTPICANFLSFLPPKPYDFLISNPPFYSKMPSDNPHKKTSRQAEFLPAKELAKLASKALMPNGSFFLCYEAAAINELFSAFSEAKLRAKTIRFVHSKPDKCANIVLFELVKKPKINAKILPPLICYENGAPSAELAAIYARTKLASSTLTQAQAISLLNKGNR